MTDSNTDAEAWEDAYLRFETPEQEIRKFSRRLIRAGAGCWPRNWRIAELFCGRGNGLHALERLGFTRLDGVDLSPRLIGKYQGFARCHVGDCRRLAFADQSFDAIIIQGGLHHLPNLPDDLAATLNEARRVLRNGGLVVIVEPWQTPFLAMVHRICKMRVARHASDKIDSLATMIEHERTTYEQWLGQPQRILELLEGHFLVDKSQVGWGKLLFVGRPRP